MGIECDVSRETELTAAFRQIRQKWGGVDVCVNNAGFAVNESLQGVRKIRANIIFPPQNAKSPRCAKSWTST